MQKITLSDPSGQPVHRSGTAKIILISVLIFFVTLIQAAGVYMFIRYEAEMKDFSASIEEPFFEAIQKEPAAR